LCNSSCVRTGGGRRRRRGRGLGAMPRGACREGLRTSLLYPMGNQAIR
jgi:hypothetical protein